MVHNKGKKGGEREKGTQLKEDEPFREIGEAKKVNIPKIMDFGDAKEGEESLETRKVENKDEQKCKGKKRVGNNKKPPKQNKMAKDKQGRRRRRQRGNHLD